MKKLLAVVLAVAMLLGMVSLASADDVQEITWHPLTRSHRASSR